ncbi:tetratricopeptide repeat protein [Providencia sp. PROV257]|uniref:SEL1-like repeat protein n=1 Tax=Providencia sp. PROV257 TaxID=2949945 RepID=UPI00234947F8|nr:tetratricopeptide repeat protein [Providencia sp. PROV257]
MLNNKFMFVTLFLCLCKPTFSYATSVEECVADTKSFTICQKLASSGDENALMTMGYFYERGVGVEKNIPEAEKIYQRLVKQNNKEGFNLLARLKGEQGKKEEAIGLYQKAINLGSPSARYNLGILYRNNGDYIRAKELFESAVNISHSSNAMMSLGDLYFDGYGVEQNMELAEKWYKEAIQMGNDTAITRLATLYGEMSDYKKAMELYNIAILKEDPEAMNYMGLLYKHGLGVEIDYQKSVNFFEKAARYNSITGLIDLGLMYEEGLGVKQSYAKAIELYEKAYQLGYTDAQLRIDFLKKKFINKDKQ